MTAEELLLLAEDAGGCVFLCAGGKLIARDVPDHLIPALRERKQEIVLLLVERLPLASSQVQ